MGLLQNVIKYVARPYVAGPTLDDAMRVAEGVRERGCAVTLCYWHGGDETADEVYEKYLAVIAAASRAGFDAHISMKVPGLAAKPELIAAVMSEARAKGLPVDIDAHLALQAEADFSAAAAAGPEGLGIAIPGRWSFSESLADRAVELGLRVRVVKGEREDPEAPDIDRSQGFLAVIDRLAGRCREVGVATHDPAIAAEALRRLADAGTPAEHELLYGLPMEPVIDVGREAGVQTRIYIPFGTAWITYAIRKALRHPGTSLPRVIRRLHSRARNDGLPRPR